MYGFLIDENSEIALRALIRELDQVGNNLAAFVGAGVSRQAGLPLWKELMAAMDKEAQKYSERTPLVPGVPGMSEAGLPTYELSFWYGFFFPAGTPRDIVRRMFDATAVAVANPAAGALLATGGTESVGSKSPEEFAAFIAEDAKTWTQVVKDSGAKAD